MPRMLATASTSRSTLSSERACGQWASTPIKTAAYTNAWKLLPARSFRKGSANAALLRSLSALGWASVRG
eukprot:7247278-Alexandrium_andersonii.AAC.1